MTPQNVWPKVPPSLTPDQLKAREAFVLLWHQILPERYSIIEKFNHESVASLPFKHGGKTLEIGAGLGEHSKFENLKDQDYFQLEYREELCRILRQKFPQDRVFHGDIELSQPWPDQFFDRIVAIHVLEHLKNLPAAIFEIRRLLAKDGFFDVVLPCEGKLSYLIARKISAERVFKKNFGMDYGPIIKNEHVNNYDEILLLLKKYFRVVSTDYFPLKVPVASANLVVSFRLMKLEA